MLSSKGLQEEQTADQLALDLAGAGCSRMERELLQLSAKLPTQGGQEEVSRAEGRRTAQVSEPTVRVGSVGFHLPRKGESTHSRPGSHCK